MQLCTIIDELGLEILAGSELTECDVCGGYVSDLLSDVVANAGDGDVWVTMQTHRNVVAVAALKDVAAIVLVNGKRPDEDTVEAARKEGVPLLLSSLPAFETVGRLYAMGLSHDRGNA